MANFFNVERHKCSECDSQIFEIVDTYMLNRINGKLVKEPYNKAIRCVLCGKTTIDFDNELTSEV